MLYDQTSVESLQIYSNSSIDIFTVNSDDHHDAQAGKTDIGDLPLGNYSKTYFWPRDLLMQPTGTVWTTFIGDHPEIIPVKFSEIPISGYMSFEVFLI